MLTERTDKPKLQVLSGKLAWYYIKSKAGLIGAVSCGIPADRGRYDLDGSPEAVDGLWELLGKCWNVDPRKRPSSQEVLDEVSRMCSRNGTMGSCRPIASDSSGLSKRREGSDRRLKSMLYIVWTLYIYQ